MSTLAEIQAEIFCPKQQYNSFGKYHYRSLEDIYRGAKETLKKFNVSLTIDDEVVLIGSRYYIKSTAKLVDENGKLVGLATAFAREEETKKGMDGAQITGSASSYARKYALNSLFCLDDTNDPDSQEKSYTYDLSLYDDTEIRKKAVNWCLNHQIEVNDENGKLIVNTPKRIEYFDKVEVKQ